MFEFFAWLRMFPDAVKKIFLTPMAGFIIVVIRYWYYAMTIPAVFVVYYLFKALVETGLMASFNDLVMSNVNIVKNIAVNCFPLITNLSAMMSCISGS